VLKLSRKTLYALEAVVDIAYNARAEPVQSKEITARQGIPQRYLEQVMQQLVRAGILKGVRGPRGGYELAKERRKITAGDIVRAAMSSTGEDSIPPIPESKLVDLVVGPIVREAGDVFLASLDKHTVEDLCHWAEERNVFAGAHSPLDYTI
jgi:Rrf2 family protein